MPFTSRPAAALLVAGLYLLFCLWILIRHRRQAATARGLARQWQSVACDGADPILIAYASQTGFAEQIAWRTAEALRDSGAAIRLCSLGELDANALMAASRALFIVSTTGEGDAPDSAARFARLATSIPLSGLSYGMLALGDRSYRNYCAFGHQLDHWLRHRQATPLFDLIEVDNADDGALRHWQASLRLFGVDETTPDWTSPAYAEWRLTERELLNPGSVGGPAYRIALTPPEASTGWQPGDIAEIGPCDPMVADDALLPHREYSIASLPGDGRIELIVRQMRYPDGRLGIGSGWLTEHAAVGSAIALRIRTNRAFHAPGDGRPMILIGNGTGLAGLRAHLKARAAMQRHRNWLIFGERSAAHDYFLKDELTKWRDQGVIERLDLAFSRDQETRVYVQHRLLDAAADLVRWANEGAAIYACGSLEGMASGVNAALEHILGVERLETMLETGLYRRDVY